MICNPDSDGWPTTEINLLDEQYPCQPVLGAIGPLQARLAHTQAEIKAIQKLRFQIFKGESGDVPFPLDQDRFDSICDHLLVTDKDDLGADTRLVGTYRLLRQNIAEKGSGFYSALEFDISPMLARHPNMHFLELGRSCVSPQYRNKRTIELLWHGTWAYVLEHNIDVMFGCASFAGTDISRHREALSYLYHHCRTSDEWHVEAKPHLAVDMDLVPESTLDHRSALKSMPPLIKGYLRLGASVASQAVLDEEFGTIDVMIILPVTNISKKYINFYGAQAERHRAA